MSIPTVGYLWWRRDIRPGDIVHIREIIGWSGTDGWYGPRVSRTHSDKATSHRVASVYPGYEAHGKTVCGNIKTECGRTIWLDDIRNGTGPERGNGFTGSWTTYSYRFDAGDDAP